MANYMEQVAEMLGVELDEEFEAIDSYLVGRVEKVKCKIIESGLCIYSNREENWLCDHLMLGQILTGDDSVEIIKPPFVPKKGVMYWTYVCDNFTVESDKWDDFATDHVRLKCGMVFRTKKEAIAARPRVYKELTGKEWRGDDE